MARPVRTGGYPCGVVDCQEVLASPGALGGHRAQHKRKAEHVQMGPVAGLTTESRMIVKGWKMEGGVRRDFESVHHIALPSSVEAERSRIGAVVAGWQPHITEVWVETRQVSQWQRVCDGCGLDFGHPKDQTRTKTGRELCRACATVEGEVDPW